MSMPDTGQIYIVDDDRDLRASLVDLISTRTPWRVRSFVDGTSWLATERDETAGCVLLDHSMPGMTGLAVLQEMERRRSGHQVIMLTGEGNIAIAVEAMRAGASDFLEKPVLFDQLEYSLRGAFARLDNALEASTRAEEARARIARLKPRERDVMMGLVEGQPNKIIAYNLGLSVRTVELYRAALMDRLSVDSVADVLKIAFAANLVSD
jgi:two-component system response regulator FixJ